MSPAQRRVLEVMADGATFLTVRDRLVDAGVDGRGCGANVYQSLVSRGWAVDVAEGWGVITDAGRAALRSDGER